MLLLPLQPAYCSLPSDHDNLHASYTQNAFMDISQKSHPNYTIRLKVCDPLICIRSRCMKFLSSGVAPLHAETPELKRHLLAPHILNIQDRKTIIDTPIKKGGGASLVVQWLRVRLPMQGTRVRAPVREDPTCHGAARPVSHGC